MEGVGGAVMPGSTSRYEQDGHADVTIISCNYGLAPERPAPLGILDAYACLKDVLKNHAKYGLTQAEPALLVNPVVVTSLRASVLFWLRGMSLTRSSSSSR